jgi:HSP20 family molecular chaperone IbpA
MDRIMSAVLGDLQSTQHEETGSQLHYNEQGDLALRCQTSGFKPEELSVDVDGDKLTVSGKHMESHEGESVERHFSRVIRLHNDLDHSKIKCELDDKGELRINVPRREQLEAPKQKVPIEMKKAE